MVDFLRLTLLRADHISEVLPQIVAIEQATQVYPWTAGQFVDAIGAGYPVWVVSHEDKEKILSEGKVVVEGFLVAMRVYDDVHVLNFAVSPKYQARGVATTLWNALLVWAMATPNLARGEVATSRVLLEVARRNDVARAVYAHWGFVQIGVRANYYHRDGRYDDALVLAYDVEEKRSNASALNPC